MTTEYDDIEDTLEIEEEIPEMSDKQYLKELKKLKKKEKLQEDYINKERMWNALKSYYEQSEKTPHMMIPLELSMMVDDIVNHMAHRPNFNGYVKNSNWLVDMTGDAKVKAFKAVADKAFSLYTTVDILTQIEHEGQKIVYYIYRKAKKKQLSSDKSVLFETLEACKIFVKEQGFKRNGPLLVVRNPRSRADYFTIGIRELVEEDVINQESNTLIFKANPFGFYSQIVWHSFINRIKKNQQIQDTVKDYQHEIYENMYASETWRNVRRQKVFYDDDGEGFVEEAAE
jgi:hypothetical protein